MYIYLFCIQNVMDLLSVRMLLRFTYSTSRDSLVTHFSGLVFQMTGEMTMMPSDNRLEMAASTAKGISIIKQGGLHREQRVQVIQYM